ncbi:MAG TPA: ammonium transporter [Candidatus Latescibacteria bacterium]|nr:ammonium transporter [Candidatus Handelsmanbacteria bacterium]HIL08408.1 ammonium transporter [Candidatus Latescibacterota bacterium]
MDGAIVACGMVSFGAAFALLKGTDRIRVWRVSAEGEQQGLNIAEHSASADLQDLFVAMDAELLNGWDAAEMRERELLWEWQ